MRFGPLPTFLVVAAATLLAAAHGERFTGTLTPASTVRYDASAGAETWQGVAPATLTRLAFDDGDLRTLRLQVEVAPADFDSGNRFRDTNARRVTFETDAHPVATFTATGVAPTEAGGDLALPAGAARTVTLRGTLALHGERRDVEVPVRLGRDGDVVDVTGAFTTRLSDYGMTAPSFLWRRVDDAVRVTLDLQVRLTPRGDD
ncbi:MAG: YceI family protein [Trueperaceae bacterium]|nr:YceI family protein [Trueperaceae bacterium]